MPNQKPTLDYGKAQARGPLPFRFWLFLVIAVVYVIAWLLN